MKTYQKTIIKKVPLLTIEYDTDAESPRMFCDTLGYFYSRDEKMQSPDGNASRIYDIMIETGDEASSQRDHIARMKKAINKETDEKVLAIYPITKYDHGGVVYSLGTHNGFDYSNNTFYIITNRTQKVLGTPKNRFENVIRQELQDYNAWVNGNVYRFSLANNYDDEREECGGYYDIDDIKNELPDEWKDENMSDYLIH